MTDNVCTPDSLQENDKHLLLSEQEHITAELNAKRDVSPLPYNHLATQIVTPKKGKLPAFVISISNINCRYKRLIFGALNAAFFRYSMTDEFTDRRKESFSYARVLWDFIKGHTINETNRASLFRDFEAWRVKEANVKTQSTGLKWINLIIQDGLGLDAFAATLTQPDIDYLQRLSETRPATHDEVDAINLNHWLAKHTWLRRDDVGIGNELYTRLSSPRILMSSFRVTIENILLHIQTCKGALLDFFKRTQFSPNELPDIKSNSLANMTHSKVIVNTHQSKEAMFLALRKALLRLEEHPATLKAALELLVFSHCNPNFRADTLKALQTNGSLNYSIKEKSRTTLRYNALASEGLFDCDFILELALTAQKSTSRNNGLPVCQAERLLFSWLMAYQTVQASDVAKLTLSDFKFVHRVNGQITHIESDYFKGRANSVHQVNTLSTKSTLGKVILRYLQDVSALQEKHSPVTTPLKPMNLGQRSLAGRLMLLCTETSLINKLATKYEEQEVTPVFLYSTLALIRNGVGAGSSRAKKELCDTQIPKSFFGLSHIKTSAVYAKSDAFDPTTLLNLNSHTNQTERLYYLDKNNEDWQNRCGRITRAVMSDIEINVFRTSSTDKSVFNSEFTKAIETIKQRSKDTLLRMKLITEKTSGSVDELGFCKKKPLIDGDLPDALYLSDSPETVLKLTHYLTELEQKHKKLKTYAPEFLFSTALPTAEWIECLFDEKRFSKESLQQGIELYRRYANVLPPHFTAQIT